MAARRILLVDAGYLIAQSRKMSRYGFPVTEQNLRSLRTVIENRFGKITDSYYFDAEYKDPKREQAIRETDKRRREAQNAQYVMAAHHVILRYITVFMGMKRKKATCHNCGNQFEQDVQAGVDVALACRAVVFALTSTNPADEIVWLAGDGDFLQALEHIHAKNLRMYLVAFEDSCSPYVCDVNAAF